MLRLVHTQHQPSLSRQSDTEMDESILLGHIAEGDAAAFELFYKMSDSIKTLTKTPRGTKRYQGHH